MSCTFFAVCSPQVGARALHAPALRFFRSWLAETQAGDGSGGEGEEHGGTDEEPATCLAHGSLSDAALHPAIGR